MSSANQTRSDRVIKCERGICGESPVELIGEEPLLIRVDGEPYTVVMRTPGEEMFHAAGLCLGEGIVDFPDDFASVGYCEDIDPNVIEIRLKPERREKVAHILQRRSFVSQTSCGICGKQMIEDLEQELLPVENGFIVDISRIFDCVKKLSENQDFYPRTRGSHAALLFDEHLEILAFAEDVGRHNALDKAVGKAFMNRQLPGARILVMSSRISYELVQKSARAHLPMMVSKSRPTALAAQMGRMLNMTLACVFGDSKLMIICGEERISKKEMQDK